MNPGAVTTHVQYLSELLASDQPGLQSTARTRILELARAVPGCLDDVGRVADPCLWADDWDELSSVVFQAAMGKSAGIGSRLDVLGFWANWLLGHPSAPVPDDLAFMRDYALLSVGDDNLLIANRAVYAVATQAARADLTSQEVRRTIAAFEQAEKDPRIDVRHGVAFASALLSGCAEDKSLRAFASEQRSRMLEDPRLLVQRQIAYGSVLGRRELSRQGSAE